MDHERTSKPSDVPGGARAVPGRPRLRELLAAISTDCSACGVCVKECGFLQRYGNPRDIALGYDPADPIHRDRPYECNLCALCTAVCPSGVTPQALFLEMRREAVEDGVSLRRHRGLLGYEATGQSRWFTWSGLPRGCDTVFFPGCALPGTRPAVTREIFRRLAHRIPSLGLVLDCCGKPSHDLGREQHFAKMFERLRRQLLDRGVRRVLVACPNCWKVFSDRAPELTVETVYEHLAAEPAVARHRTAPITIHDPCVFRFAEAAPAAVRSLVASCGAPVQEMRHHGRRAFCCGEGGNAGASAPELAEAWRDARVREADGRRVVTYCAGCANHLGDRLDIIHVLDLVVDPTRALGELAPADRGWKTYWNRLRLKFELRREIRAATARERASNQTE